MRRRGSVRLGELLPAVVADWQKQLNSPLLRVRQHWGGVAGREVAAHALPIALRDGILTVSVDSSVWAAELAGFHTERIVGGLNQHLGSQQITRLRFIVGRRSRALKSGEDTHGRAPDQV